MPYYRAILTRDTTESAAFSVEAKDAQEARQKLLDLAGDAPSASWCFTPDDGSGPAYLGDESAMEEITESQYLDDLAYIKRSTGDVRDDWKETEEYRRAWMIVRIVGYRVAEAGRLILSPCREDHEAAMEVLFGRDEGMSELESFPTDYIEGLYDKIHGKRGGQR